MKKQFLFFMVIMGVSVSSLSMDLKQEIKEKKESRGSRAFTEMYNVYMDIDEQERDKRLEFASDRVLDVCFGFAKQKSDIISIGGYGPVNLLVNFEAVKKDKKFFRDKVFNMLKTKFESQQSFANEYNGKTVLFEEDVNARLVVKEPLLQDILCLGAFIANENNKEFKEVLSKVLTWIVNWKWIQEKFICKPLKDVEFIESEIEMRATGDMLLDPQDGNKLKKLKSELDIKKKVREDSTDIEN